MLTSVSTVFPTNSVVNKFSSSSLGVKFLYTATQFYNFVLNTCLALSINTTATLTSTTTASAVLSTVTVTRGLLVGTNPHTAALVTGLVTSDKDVAGLAMVDSYWHVYLYASAQMTPGWTFNLRITKPAVMSFLSTTTKVAVVGATAFTDGGCSATYVSTTELSMTACSSISVTSTAGQYLPRVLRIGPVRTTFNAYHNVFTDPLAPTGTRWFESVWQSSANSQINDITSEFGVDTTLSKPTYHVEFRTKRVSAVTMNGLGTTTPSAVAKTLQTYRASLYLMRKVTAASFTFSYDNSLLTSDQAAVVPSGCTAVATTRTVTCATPNTSVPLQLITFTMTFTVAWDIASFNTTNFGFALSATYEKLEPAGLALAPIAYTGTHNAFVGGSLLELAVVPVIPFNFVVALDKFVLSGGNLVSRLVLVVFPLASDFYRASNLSLVLSSSDCGVARNLAVAANLSFLNLTTACASNSTISPMKITNACVPSPQPKAFTVLVTDGYAMSNFQTNAFYQARVLPETCFQYHLGAEQTNSIIAQSLAPPTPDIVYTASTLTMAQITATQYVTVVSGTLTITLLDTTAADYWFELQAELNTLDFTNVTLTGGCTLLQRSQRIIRIGFTTTHAPNDVVTCPIGALLLDYDNAAHRQSALDPYVLRTSAVTLVAFEGNMRTLIPNALNLRPASVAPLFWAYRVVDRRVMRAPLASAAAQVLRTEVAFTLLPTTPTVATSGPVTVAVKAACTAGVTLVGAAAGPSFTLNNSTGYRITEVAAGFSVSFLYTSSTYSPLDLGACIELQIPTGVAGFVGLRADIPSTATWALDFTLFPVSAAMISAGAEVASTAPEQAWVETTLEMTVFPHTALAAGWGAVLTATGALATALADDSVTARSVLSVTGFGGVASAGCSLTFTAGSVTFSACSSVASNAREMFAPVSLRFGPVRMRHNHYEAIYTAAYNGTDGAFLALASAPSALAPQRNTDITELTLAAPTAVVQVHLWRKMVTLVTVNDPVA